ncbi:MAG TPA: hypothetical protein VNZ22_01055 [Bacillota bacterium]|nr:hypothetical protein [Bacillota bacterium]
MKRRWSIFTLVLAGVTLAVLLLSVPGSLREALHRGDFYVFSSAFFEDLPKRLTGPGRFRFILQPLIAVILGIRSGIADARMGRPAYLFGLLFDRKLRPELLKSGFSTIVNLLLMGILLDSIAQWLILGASYPGAALVVGPVLVAAPYSLARAVANRCARLRNKQGESQDIGTLPKLR